MAVRVGIVGVSGYTGIELLRLVSSHPHLILTAVAAGKAAGEPLASVWPGLSGLPALSGLTVTAVDPAALAAQCDAVFLALPHGVAATTAPALLDRGVTVVDLGADYRLKEPAVYERTYGLAHPSPKWLEHAIYGLVELQREALRGARLIANPGCYPTAVALAAWPLVTAGLAGDWLVADCLSGVSGAGRTPGPRNLYCEVADSATPYAVSGTHRHVPEIEQTLGIPVTFTPHLVPLVRGMIATVHARPPRRVTASEVRALYAERYGREVMIVLRDEPPATADVRGTNRAHLCVTADADRGVVTVTCAIDNLVKGASGQAIQALNVALGLPETAGLPIFPLLP